MKISLRIPKCLNWLVAKLFPFPDDEAMADRAKLTGSANWSKQYGNQMASFEVKASYREPDAPQDERRSRP